MNYSQSPNHVKLIVFKKSGKWKYEESLDMEDHYHNLTPHDAVLNCLKNTRWSKSLQDYIFVVPEPFHNAEYPVCINIQESKE
jgi:hypothetical protein